MSYENIDEANFYSAGPAVFYGNPSYQPDFCSSSSSEYYGHDNSQCTLTSSTYKNPQKLNGLDVELAVRKEPFKPYPKKAHLHKQSKIQAKESKVPFVYKHNVPGPDTVILDNSVDGPTWSSRFCLKRVYSLLLREDSTEQLVDRIRELWAYYVKMSKDVFVYDNMDIVANIILVLATSFIRNPFSQEMFDKVMQRLQRGIYMEASPKEAVDIKRLAYSFTVLGLAIVEGHPIAQTSIASIVGVWLDNMIEKRQTRYPKLSRTARRTTTARRCPLTSRLMKRSEQLSTMIPDNILMAALEKSLLSRIISKYFIDGSHTEGYISILSLLKSCCDVSEVIRQRLLCLQVLDPILLKLAMSDPTNRILLSTSDFIHSYFGIHSGLFQHDAIESHKECPDPNSIIPILEKDSFQILLTRFVQQLGHCSSKSLLNMRNDTAFLICLLNERVPISGEYYEGFEILFASIISSAILDVKNLDIAYLIDSTPEDFELLQYIMYILKCIVEAGSGQKIIEEYSLVAVLLTFILGPCALLITPKGVNIAVSGEGEKGNDLETAVWNAIQAIAKHCPLSLLTPHGVPSLLTFLQTYGEAGEGDQRILAMFMHIIRILLTTPEEDSCASDEVMGYFIQRDGMAIFLSVLRKVVNQQDFDALQETIASNALYCCAALGYFDFAQKELFVCLEGVSILTMLMRHLLCNTADKRHMNPAIQMAFSECIGCCVAYYPPALERFLAMEGIFRLLDLLEVSAGPAAPVHITNCILQLCDYPRCVDQLLFWHRPKNDAIKRIVFGEEVDDLARLNLTETEGPQSGDILQQIRPPSDQRLSSILCTLWKEEEDRFEVLRDPEGCIASITHPLMSKFARTYNQANENEKGKRGACKSCLDMSLSLRPKIFLIIKRIVEVTKTEATLFDGLSLGNQVIMQVIINFVDLKKSEIYLEIAEEMESRETPLMTPGDADIVLRLADISRNTLATVLETQRYLIRRFNEKEEMHEHEFYSLIKQCRLQDHLMAAKEIEYLARTTNYNYLVEKRLWQKSELEGAVKELSVAFTKNSRIHRLSDGELNITAWPCRERHLISENKLNAEDADCLENYNDNDDLTLDPEKEDEDIGAEYLISSTTSTATEVASLIKSFPSADILVTNYAVTEPVTPEPLEGGFYQVSPHRLKEALRRLLSFRKRHQNWIKLAENDQGVYWQTRAKWKKDWYPLIQGKHQRPC